MTYLLDSNHAVAFLNGDARIGARLALAQQAADVIGVSVVVVSELFFGAYHSQRVQENVDRIKQRLLPNLLLYEFDLAAAEEFGRIRAGLRAKGKPIPTADIQIAAIARLHSCILLTADRHFANVDGLLTENWLT